MGETLAGGAGRDTVSGGAGDDHVDGEAGSDILADGSGSDTVFGGSGDDLVTVALDSEADIFDGGTGQDTLDLSGTRAGISADLLAGIATGPRPDGTSSTVSRR